MSYTKTTWLETSMSTTQKMTALDNLEGMYGEAVSYIDGITHSERYYDETTCDSMYFTSANDGSGSGLIAKYLDGYTAEEIMAAGSPPGVIAMWSGSEASIPSGWVLCNGLNSTPDLRDRFVVAAGSHYARNDTGGANTLTTSGTVTVAGHSLTASEIPKHTHGSITDYYPTNFIYTSETAGSLHYAHSIADNTNYTEYAGSGSAHTHSASWDGTDDQEKRPPFYALCFIMVAAT
jgi:hypothetical protein